MEKTDLKLLFIEDSEIDVELVLHAMKREGFEVSWDRVDVENDLRTALASSAPDLILSDFSMPRFDGATALRVAQEMAPEVPFIFVSGTIGEERAIEAIRLGATDYVLKSNTRRLGTAVRRALIESAERERVRTVEADRARLVEVLEATSDCVCVTEPAGKILYLNTAGRRLIGAAETGDVGKTLSDILPPWVNELLTREGRPAAEKNGSWHGETAILNSEGKEIPVSQVTIAHHAADGQIRFFSTIARDIRERKAYEARLQHFANYDALTGLPNRNLLADRAAQAIAYARRSGGMLALLVLNLDRFKLVNDSAGHAAGDKLLCMVASRLDDLMQEGDTVARLGSDSFAVLATDLRADQVWGLVRKIRTAMQPEFSIDGHAVHATLGIGASVYPRDGEGFDILLRNADAAMHRAKAAGQNVFQFYAAAMTREATDRVELEHELRLAIERSELEIHFQPQIVLATGRLIGVEALMRWHHSARGPISPTRFIPIAEDSSLIYPLGEFALRQAIRQLKAWDDAGVAPLRVAVNVSARQFHSRGFLDMVGQVLREAEVDLDRFELELTESVLVEDQDKVIANLKRLKAIGVQIAVDDFGTGYSSLSYLSRLPIDCLKIDQSFVRRISEHGHDAAIAQAIISLAHALGLRVVAEGVETEAQQRFLNTHHCDEGQGYLFSRAVPADNIAALAAAGFSQAGGRQPI